MRFPIPPLPYTSEVSENRQLYGVWRHMLHRCYYPEWASYKFYGAKGIRVCAQWTSSLGAFQRWAKANGWEPGLEIDRLDNTANYSPGNCRIISPKDHRKKDFRPVRKLPERQKERPLM